MHRLGVGAEPDVVRLAPLPLVPGDLVGGGEAKAEGGVEDAFRQGCSALPGRHDPGVKRASLAALDLRPLGVKGNAAEAALERAGITCNKNGVPGDPEKPTVTSGVRLGTAAGCARGFGVAEFREIGGLIGDVLGALGRSPDGDSALEAEVRNKVKALCAAHPIYTD